MSEFTPKNESPILNYQSDDRCFSVDTTVYNNLLYDYLRGLNGLQIVIQSLKELTECDLSSSNGQQKFSEIEDKLGRLNVHWKNALIKMYPDMLYDVRVWQQFHGRPRSLEDRQKRYAGFLTERFNPGFCAALNQEFDKLGTAMTCVRLLEEKSRQSPHDLSEISFRHKKVLSRIGVLGKGSFQALVSPRLRMDIDRIKAAMECYEQYLLAEGEDALQGDKIRILLGHKLQLSRIRTYEDLGRFCRAFTEDKCLKRKRTWKGRLAFWQETYFERTLGEQVAEIGRAAVLNCRG